MNQLIECVPNISEGRDTEKIKQIVAEIEAVEGVKLLDVDSGKSTNRTVITFVGNPQSVIEAAFKLIKKASELIDMRLHKGEHPRMGATDVCPLIPISGITMEETVQYAIKLGKRVGEELGIPGYFYENAATVQSRKNLAYCRQGEYEGLDKLSKSETKPDFGISQFNDFVKKTGAIAIGARDFLIAYNINLNTTSSRKANSIAFDIREAGRILREGNSITGKIILDDTGEPKRKPGTLKSVKGIGWFIEEFGIAQLSLNLTNIAVTPMHIAFDEACEKARSRGIRVTGSELIGLVPLKAMLDAANYFLIKQERSLGISEVEKIKIAIKSLGLDDLAPFIPEEKIIEYCIKEPTKKKLINQSLQKFADATASESPAPGGGSVAAYCGAIGVSLATMVANLSAGKRGWEKDWQFFSDWAVKGQTFKNELLALVDSDTIAFNKIMDSFGLPNSTEDEKKHRKIEIQKSTKSAMEVPFLVAQKSLESMEFMKIMAEKGNPNSITDAGVGALCAKAAIFGAILNVKINAASLDDKGWVNEILEKCEQIKLSATNYENEIIAIVESKI
jgi:glutamate formiminotransferase / formiminotetrahydrofolate cyclodeaminase